MHGTFYYIVTEGPPIFDKPFDKPHRLHLSIFNNIKREFADMTTTGITRVSKSNWASLIVILNKNGKSHVVGDYRKLNAQTVPDHYPLSRLYNAFSRLSGKCTFSYIYRLD